MTTRTKLHFADLPKEYAGLCALLMPRPIHDAAEYTNISEIADAMALWQDEFTPDQRDYFDLLCSLMEDHDRERVRWSKVSVRVRLRHLLTESPMTAAGLLPVAGVGSAVSAHCGDATPSPPWPPPESLAAEPL